MGETLSLFTPLFNKLVQIESRPEHLTGESGALIQREIMERSGIIDWLAARLLLLGQGSGAAGGQ